MSKISIIFAIMALLCFMCSILSYIINVTAHATGFEPLVCGLLFYILYKLEEMEK